MMKKTRRFLLIDGSLLLHKSWGIHKRLSVKINDEPILTGIPYGFLRTIVRLNDKYKPCRTCVVFDNSVMPRRLFNHKMNKARKLPEDVTPRYIVYPGYKQSRSSLKPEIAHGKVLLDKFLDCLGVSVAYASPEYEADDVISYITHECTKQTPCEVIIVSDDKDFNQLIRKTSDINVFIHKKGDKIMNKRIFKEQFGFPPSRFVSYLSLLGDSSDDIPGIKGLGPKRAGNLTRMGFKAIGEALDSSQRKIYKRNKRLITLSQSRRVVMALSHGKFDKKGLNKLLNKYKMVSFLRTNEQEILRSLKPVIHVKEK